MCGGFITAWAEVKRGEEIIWPRRTFENGDCRAAEPVTIRVVLKAGGTSPVVTQVPFEDFAKEGLVKAPGIGVDLSRTSARLRRVQEGISNGGETGPPAVSSGVEALQTKPGAGLMSGLAIWEINPIM